MFAAFERGNEPTDLDIASSMNSFVPRLVPASFKNVRAERIAALKQWSCGRARPSTSTPAASLKTRKLGV